MTQQTSQDYTGLSGAEKALLRARNRADLSAVLALRQAAAQLEGTRDDAFIPIEPEARQRYIALNKAAFSLLCEIGCAEELLWYADTNAAHGTPQEAGDLCISLRRLLNRIDTMTGKYLMIGETDISRFLFTKVPQERLRFVLLHQLIALWSEDLSLNTLELYAGHESPEQLRITLTLRRDPSRASAAVPEPSAPPLRDAALPDAPERLTARFCSTYHAQILRHSAEGALSCTVRLPAAAPAEQPVQVASDAAPLPLDEISACHAALSCLLPTDVILWADAETD